MVTAEKRGTRIREPMEPSGFINGLREAARKYKKYGLSTGNLSRWIRDGKVQAQLINGVMVIGEKSLRAYIQAHYRPERDNQARRTRSRTIPEMQAEQAASAGPGQARAGGNGSSPAYPSLRPGSGQAHAVGRNGTGSAVPTGVSPARPAAPNGRLSEHRIPAGTHASDIPQGVPIVLDNRGWYQLYVNKNQSKWGEATVAKQKSLVQHWIPAFPALDITVPSKAREAILDWLGGLQTTAKGRADRPMASSSKATYLGEIVTFLNWLRRNYNYDVPDLKDSGFAKNGTGVPITAEKTRLALKACRNDTEVTLVYLFASTGMRNSDLVTIHPDLVHSENGCHWVEVFGKRTKANPEGYRLIPLLDEVYRRLKNHLDCYGELTWVKFSTNPELVHIGGVIEPLDPRIPIDLTEPRETGRPPKTFRAVPVKGAKYSVRDVINRILVDAGVKLPKMGTHGWRHAITDEVLDTERPIGSGDIRHTDWVLGHFKGSEISNHYTHIPIRQLCAHWNKYGPRKFLREAAPQGQLGLVGD